MQPEELELRWGETSAGEREWSLQFFFCISYSFKNKGCISIQFGYLFYYTTHIEVCSVMSIEDYVLILINKNNKRFITTRFTTISIHHENVAEAAA